MPRPHALSKAFLSFALLLALAGCGDPPELEAEPGVASEQQPIVNGNAGTAFPGNAVRLPGCSAVALDEEWVLTAKHCTVLGTWSGSGSAASLTFTPDFTRPTLTAGVDVAQRLQPAESRTIREIHYHPTADLALLRVHPFTTVSPRLEPWGRDAAAGTNLYCFGQGDNQLPVDGTGTTIGTVGALGSTVWRNATMNVASVTTTGYTFVPNASGQIQWMGDSGGPCIYSTVNPVTLQPRHYVTGIQSSATFRCPGSTCTTATAQSVTDVFQAGLTPAATVWVQDIRQRAPLFFYERPTGVGYVSLLQRNGTYASVAPITGFSTNWTHVVGLHNDTLFFYDAATGLAATATLDKNGRYAGGSVVPTRLATGWSHVAAVGRDGLFFFNTLTGAGATARVDTHGRYTSGKAVANYACNSASPFSCSVTAFQRRPAIVTGTRSGGLFFYSTSGVGETATVDASLNYAYVASLSGFSYWSHVAAVNDNGLLFYDDASGAAYTAFIDASGRYQSYGPVASLTTGTAGGVASSTPLKFRFVVGAGTGGVFLLDSSARAGVVGRVSGGQYSYADFLLGFSNWTNVTSD